MVLKSKFRTTVCKFMVHRKNINGANVKMGSDKKSLGLALGTSGSIATWKNLPLRFDVYFFGLSEYMNSKF